MNNKDYLEYLRAYKNPLNKKYRWEVNQAFKVKRISNDDRISLLKVKDKDLQDVVECIAQRVPVDVAQIGNYYFKRALYLYRQQKRYAEKPLNFSKGVSFVGSIVKIEE